MGKFINDKVVKDIQEKEQNNLALQGLGQQLAQEKLKGMQKDAVISQLGQELSKVKLEIIQLQGGM